MDKIEAFRTIAAQAERGDLIFPTDVSASLQIQHALDDPGCHIDQAVKLVSADPLLSSRTVAIANSAAYNPSGLAVTNVRNAVSRLGFLTLRSLVAAIIVRQFSNMLTNPELRLLASQLWEHSAHVAALSHVIAKRVTKQDPESALFAGVVHSVGGFYLFSRMEEFPDLLEATGIEAWRNYGERVIGRGVMKKLGIPENIMVAMEVVWSGAQVLPLVPFNPRNENSASLLLGNTLRLAKVLSPVVSPFDEMEFIEPLGTNIASRIDFECGDGTLQSVLHESAEEVRSLTSALLMT